MSDKIEIYSGNDGKTPTINISMSIEAAEEIIYCFKNENCTNPKMAELLEEVMEAARNSINCIRYIKKLGE